MRYYILQVSLRRAGWTDLPAHSARQHEVIRWMDKVSKQRPHYALRVHQQPHSWDPPKIGVDPVADVVAHLDRIGRSDGILASHQIKMLNVIPEEPVVEVEAGAGKATPPLAKGYFIARDLVNDESTKYAITRDMIEDAVNKHVRVNRKMMGAFVRRVDRAREAGEILPALEVPSPEAQQEADARTHEETVASIWFLLSANHGYVEHDGVFYPRS